MGWIGRVQLLIELSPVVAVDKQTQGTLQCIRTTRETARRSCQTGQVVAQLGVVSFHRVGIGFAFRNFISAQVIPQAVIGIKCIAVILLGLGRIVYHLLNSWLSALPDHFPAQITARLPVYDRDDVDPVFLLPIKVNNSSISAVLTSSGHRRFRQAGGAGLDPQRNRAVVNTKMACDPAQVHAIHIHLHGLLAHFIRIAMLFRFRRVLAPTMHAADTL